MAYANRFGQTYYLHKGTTKTGKPRYFAARSIVKGVLAAMPAGFEFAESINGVVSVRRTDTSPSTIPEVHVEAIRKEMSRHMHLRHHAVEARRNEIIIYEPLGLLSEETIRSWEREFGVARESFLVRNAQLQRRVRYTPVMKFLPATWGTPGTYMAYRMSYRGEGGWLSLSAGRLGKLVRAYVRCIDTDAFFELF